MFLLTLYAAGRADDADLRAHVLANLAAHHHHLGYDPDCLQLARLGEVDKRVSPPVRMMLHGSRPARTPPPATPEPATPSSIWPNTPTPPPPPQPAPPGVAGRPWSPPPAGCT
jgi:hypothetical protein